MEIIRTTNDAQEIEIVCCLRQYREHFIRWVNYQTAGDPITVDDYDKLERYFYGRIVESERRYPRR